MIREGVATVLKELLGVEEIPFNVPPHREMGDFSSAICLSLAKERRQPPMEIAKETGRLKSKLPPYIREITVTPPGYLNFKVDWPALAQDLIPQILEKGDLFGRPASIQKEKVFIEHTSVNPNKAMHIGHLRNAVLGDTVARVLEWLGFSTEVCNYIDDTGLQVVDVVTAFLYLDPPFYVEGTIRFWSSSGQRSQRINLLTISAGISMPVFRMSLRRIPCSSKKEREVLHRIEGGSHPIAFFAKELAKRLFRPIWRPWPNFPSSTIFSTGNRISSHRGFWEATFELLKEKGALRFETEGPNEGCWVVPFGGIVETEEGVKSLDKILVRSNGSVTYTGKDVAYQLWKFGLLKKDFLYKTVGTPGQRRSALDDRPRGRAR